MVTIVDGWVLVKGKNKTQFLHRNYNGGTWFSPHARNISGSIHSCLFSSKEEALAFSKSLKPLKKYDGLVIRHYIETWSFV